MRGESCTLLVLLPMQIGYAIPCHTYAMFIVLNELVNAGTPACLVPLKRNLVAGPVCGPFITLPTACPFRSPLHPILHCLLSCLQLKGAAQCNNNNSECWDPFLLHEESSPVVGLLWIALPPE